MRRILMILGLVLMVAATTEAFAQQAAKHSDPRTAKDPRNTSPSSAYSAQKKQKDIGEDKHKRLMVCSLARSRACSLVFEDDMRRCSVLESDCQRTPKSNEDFSCTTQRCELEKVACMVDVTSNFQTCLTAIQPANQQAP